MVKFIGLKIQGIRSVGDSPQCINFLTPLTIIQGPNGTGKTTIIEALNYVTTGSLPAGNMATFIHNHQIANKPRVDALVQLIFEDIKGNRCTATKRMTSATKGGKLTTKSDEFTLKVVDKHGNLKASSSKVSDFNKEMLNLFGVPKAVLEYVLFCHQEDSNWPLSEPKELKKRFDAIFEVTKFVKALENIKKNVKEMNNQIQLIDKEMPHLLNNLRALTELRMNYDKNINISRDIKTTIERLLEEKRNTEQELLTIRKQRERAITANHEFEILQGQIATHRRYMDGLCDKEYAGTRDDLIAEIENLKQNIALEDADNQRANIMQEIRSIAEEIDKAKKAEAYYRDQMIQYNSKQMMMKNREQDYMSLVKQYSDEYNVPINPEFAEYLQMELDATQTSGEKFIKKEQERINVLDEQIDKLRCRLAELKSNSQTKRQEFGRLSQMIGNMEKELKNADNTFQAVGKISQEIGKLETQLKSIGDAKLLDDLWEIVQTLQSELNTLRMDMMEFGGHNDDANSAAAAVDALKEKTTNVLEGANEKLGRTLEHIGTLKRRVQMQSQLMEMKDRKAVAGEKVVHRDTLKQNLDERKEQLAEVENILTTASKESPQLENELRALEAERRKAKESLQAFERDSNVQIERMNTAIRKLAEYKADNERDKQASAATENFREKMDEQKNLIEQLAEQRRQRENQLSGAEVQKSQLRQLGEQLRRMEIQNEVKILSRKLEEAKENAILDGVESIAELKKKEDRLNQRVLNLNNQIHQKNGEQLQLRKKIDELKIQLAKPQYEQAKKNLLEKMVERNITNSAIEDLEKYYKVVDDAIINFHQQKMEQINQILRDLWIRVYRANDIETIKIKSKPVGGSEKKKSYDYSVVMTVDQTDLDMRDRCSAGQKVLASIVIRVALADVFAGGCRILALDEPTTNLDADKVENIGQMLKDLLEIRNNPAATGSAFGAQELNNADDADFEVNGANSSHETFLQPPAQQNSSMQLIVITHDHRLVEHLHLACRPEYIYALSKDDKGISRIKAYNNVVEAGDDLTNAMD